MKKEELICICCPLGCMMEVEWQGGESLSVRGNGCRRGEAYAKKELTNPTRMLTTTVLVESGKKNVVAVKTEKDVPKDRIMDCISHIKKVKLKAPVTAGEVVVENVAHTGIRVVTTAAVDAR